MDKKSALLRDGQPRPAPLFCNPIDTLRSVILRYDALKMADESNARLRADLLSDTIRILGQKLDYDRSCGKWVAWSELHDVANGVYTYWMRAMMNGSGFGDDDYNELSDAIECARHHLTPSLS